MNSTYTFFSNGKQLEAYSNDLNEAIKIGRYLCCPDHLNVEIRRRDRIVAKYVFTSNGPKRNDNTLNKKPFGMKRREYTNISGRFDTELFGSFRNYSELEMYADQRRIAVDEMKVQKVLRYK